MTTLDPRTRTSDPAPTRTSAPATPATDPAYRIGAVALVAGCLLMATGGVLDATSGANFFATMTESDPAAMTAGLVAADAARNQIVTGFALWIAGVPTISVGVTLLSRRTIASAWSGVARWAAGASTGAAIVFFSAMLGIVVGLAPAAAAGDDVVAVTRALGTAAVTADWVVTTLVMAGSIGSLVLSARGRWAPRWLVGLAITTYVVSAVSLLAYVVGADDLTMLIVPVGFTLGLSTGVIAFRSTGASPSATIDGSTPIDVRGRA